MVRPFQRLSKLQLSPDGTFVIQRLTRSNVGLRTVIFYAFEEHLHFFVSNSTDLDCVVVVVSRVFFDRQCRNVVVKHELGSFEKLVLECDFVNVQSGFKIRYFLH